MRQGGGERTAWTRIQIWEAPTYIFSGLIHYAQRLGLRPPSEAPASRKSFNAMKEEEGTAGGQQGNCGIFRDGFSLPEGAGPAPHQQALPLQPASALLHDVRSTPLQEWVTVPLFP